MYRHKHSNICTISLLHGSSALLRGSGVVPSLLHFIARLGRASVGCEHGLAELLISNHMSSGSSTLRSPPRGKKAEHQNGNLCFGCGVQHGHSADWIEEDEFIKLSHPIGRGNWCLCCHLLHKASFKEYADKKELRRWQLDSPANDAEFKAAHAEYVAVRRGGGVWKPEEHPRTTF